MRTSKAWAIFLMIVLASGMSCAIAYQDSQNYEKQVPVGLRIKSTVLSVVVDVKPETLNLRSKGKWITCRIELPEDYNVSDIDVSTILLNDTIPAEMHPIGFGDEDGDGIPDLMVKFDRAEVKSYILANINMTKLSYERSMTIMLTITGKLDDGTPFQGSDTIRILLNVPGKGDTFIR